MPFFRNPIHGSVDCRDAPRLATAGGAAVSDDVKSGNFNVPTLAHLFRSTEIREVKKKKKKLKIKRTKVFT